MKRILGIVAVVLLLNGCAAPPRRSALDDLTRHSAEDATSFAAEIRNFLYQGHSEAEAISKGQLAVIDSLTDPESARFRKVHLKAYMDGAVLCGEVNAKNKFGGYVGFRRFVAGMTGARVERADSGYAHIDTASNAGIDIACGFD